MNRILALALLFTCATANAGWHKTFVLVKEADESRAETTTFAADSVLVGNLLSGATYQFEMDLHWTSTSNTPDAKFQYHDPFQTSTIAAHCDIADAGVFGNDVGLHYFDVPIVVSITANEESFLRCKGVIFVGTGGTFEVQWAQNTSNAAATVMEKGAYYKLMSVTK